MAKSHDKGGVDLVQHSIEAASAALTAATRILIDEAIKDDVYKCCFIGALVHDLGKAAAGFQEMIKHPERPSWKGRRHEIVSAALFVHNFRNLKQYLDHPVRFFAIYLSIVVHHKPYKESVAGWPEPIPEEQWPPNAQFRIMWEETLCNKDLLQETWKEILNNLQQDDWARQLIDDQWLPHELEVPSVDEILCTFGNFVDGMLENFSNFGYGKGIVDWKLLPSPQDKFFISLVRSLVTVGDHLASGSNNYVPHTPDLAKYEVAPKRSSLRPFQEKIGKNGTAMLRAPTGSGKTEAAFNWLKHNQQQEQGLSRIFYVLPIQASINAMFKRWTKFLQLNEGYKVVALHHSRAANVYFHLLDDDQTNLTRREKLKEMEKSINEPLTIVKSQKTEPFSSFVLDSPNWKRLFGKDLSKVKSYIANDMARLAQEIFYPIKVTTPHQLLKVMMQGQGWEPMVCDFTKCLVVFDEIHSYDSNLTGLILNLAKTLIEQFDAKVLFMSATFPDLLKNLIHTHIRSDIPYIEPDANDPVDKQFIERKRHKIKHHDSNIAELIPKLSHEIQQAESTLIICNTVRDAQSAYLIVKSMFPKKDTILLHSRFKYGDRQKKERRIIEEPSDGKILVATQVVEVSLDIDFELGIITLAPLDALVQRLGRINRAGTRPLQKPNVHIASPGEYANLIYDKTLLEKSKHLLESCNGSELSEIDLITLINNLYTEEYWKETGEQAFTNATSHETISNFKTSIVPGTFRPWIDQIMENRERVTVDVLLEHDWNEYTKYAKRGLLKSADLLIPAYIKKEQLQDANKLQPRMKNSPPVLKKDWYEYSEEMGLTIKTKPEEDSE